LLATPNIKKRFEEMLGGKRAPAFLSSVVSAVNANKQLKDCEPMSVISSAAIAAAMDLPINPSLGFAHIVPYQGVAQFQMGWKGFIQLAMRSGQYKTINLAPVLEGQIVNHNPFTGEMQFNPEAKSKDVVGYLLYFKLLNGYEKYFYMTYDQVMAHGKRYSKAFQKNYGPWKDDFEAMALKTVCKMGLSKFGILSIDMQKAVEVDQAEVDESGEAVSFPDQVVEGEDQPAPEVKTTSSKLKNIVADKNKAATDAEIVDVPAAKPDDIPL